MLFVFALKEEDEFEEGAHWGVEPSTETNPMTEVEPANSGEENKETSLALISELITGKAFEESMKVIDKRLLNMERKFSLVIPLLRKALKDEV